MHSRIFSRSIEILTRSVRLFKAGDERSGIPPCFYWSVSFAGLWLRVGVLAFVLTLSHTSRAVA